MHNNYCFRYDQQFSKMVDLIVLLSLTQYYWGLSEFCVHLQGIPTKHRPAFSLYISPVCKECARSELYLAFSMEGQFCIFSLYLYLYLHNELKYKSKSN